MRQVRYRAWDRQLKRMIVPALEIKNIGLGDGSVVIDELTQEGHELDWMECTGLKDFTGRDIYEGDIFELQVKNEFGSLQTERVVVMYCEHEGNWSLSSTPEDPDYPHMVMGGQIVTQTVIGNIYENPDLLAKPE